MKPLAVVSVMLALAMPAMAQTNQQQNPAGQADKCRMQPDQGGKQQPGGGNLTDKLNDCGGVLKPPATGDQGMAAPAPDEGKTPVIKPGDVPAQPPAQ
jgi:predicted transglutaminase-like cysteine proteinase